MEKVTLKQYITPFSDINQFIKALMIVSKIYCSTKQNFKQVHLYITNLITPLTEVEVQNFVQKVTLYPLHYPYQQVVQLEKFKCEIIEFAEENKSQSITIISEAMKCSFCPESPHDWFEFNTPPLAKDVTLYSMNKIGKY